MQIHPKPQNPKTPKPHGGIFRLVFYYNYRMKMKANTMMSTILLLALSIVVCAAEHHENDTLHFVFELTRHGARAPIKQCIGYQVESGQLTAQGMR